MPYELRLNGAAIATFDDETAGVAAATERLRRDPEAELELIDLATGRAAAPGGSIAWRQELIRKIGM